MRLSQLAATLFSEAFAFLPVHGQPRRRPTRWWQPSPVWKSVPPSWQWPKEILIRSSIKPARRTAARCRACCSHRHQGAGPQGRGEKLRRDRRVQAADGVPARPRPAQRPLQGQEWSILSAMPMSRRATNRKLPPRRRKRKSARVISWLRQRRSQGADHRARCGQGFR
jgi:hypothetical protein